MGLESRVEALPKEHQHTDGNAFGERRGGDTGVLSFLDKEDEHLGERGGERNMQRKRLKRRRRRAGVVVAHPP